MTKTPPQKKWPELYKDALLESDRNRLPERIDEAERAIQQRALQLWYAPSPEIRERREMETALRFLALLKSVAANSDTQLG